MRDYNNCPYCQQELQGHSDPWGMSPEGWNYMKQKHDKEHKDKVEDSVDPKEKDVGKLATKILFNEMGGDKLVKKFSKQIISLFLESLPKEEDCRRYGLDWATVEYIKQKWSKE